MLFATGLKSPEAPVLLKDGRWLVVEMGAGRGCITLLAPDGRKERLIATTGRPNGLAIDGQQNIWVAESANPPSLMKVTMAGVATPFLNACNEAPFLFPNDLAFGPDGALYMTDSGVLGRDTVVDGKLRDDFLEMPMDGRVFRVDTRQKVVQQLDRGMRFTNGLAFARDGSLYVSETLTGMIYRYPWRDGTLHDRRPFSDVIDRDGSEDIRGPDGMAFDENGNLYVAVWGQGHIAVVDAGGRLVDRLRTQGLRPTNVAFGPRGDRTIYVTEDELGVVEAIPVGTDGLPLHDGSTEAVD